MERRAISIASSALEDKPALTKLAEDANYSIIFNSGESIPIFGVMAYITNRAKIGSGVIRGIAHDPRNLAEHCLDLQRLSNNRFILGLGAGTKRLNINQLGQELDRPSARTRELIILLREIWATPLGKPVEFSGKYYQLGGTSYVRPFNKKSGVPNPPIYLAAVNKSMLRLAGELCDGLCGHPIASVPFIENVVWPTIDEGLKRSGRTRADFDHCAWIITAISNDRQEALRSLKLSVGRFMATRSYAIIPDSQGLQQARLAIQEAFFKNPGDDNKLIDSVPDDVAALHGIYGTPDDVRRQFQRYVGVVDTPTLFPASSYFETSDSKRDHLKLMIETFGQ